MSHSKIHLKNRENQSYLRGLQYEREKKKTINQTGINQYNKEVKAQK